MSSPDQDGRFICSSCGYVYDPAEGDPLSDVPPRAPFDGLPEGWCCPMCYADRDAFDPLD